MTNLNYLFCIFLLTFSFQQSFAQIDYPEWKDSEKALANTAQAKTNLSEEGKRIFYYLNLTRINPPKFAKTYLNPHSAPLNSFLI